METSRLTARWGMSPVVRGAVSVCARARARDCLDPPEGTIEAGLGQMMSA